MIESAVLAIVGIEQFDDFELVKRKVSTYIARMQIHPVLIISGENPGPNQMAKDIARQIGINYKPFPIDWEEHGKPARYIRDDAILQTASHIIAFTDNSDIFLTRLIDKAFDARKNVLKVPVTKTAGTYLAVN